MTRKALAVAGLAMLMAVTASTTRAASAPHDGARSASRCPTALEISDGGRWYDHTLAPGVTVSHRDIPDALGTVKLYVLRAQLTRPGVHLGPLYTVLAHRSPLSRLARHRAGLVAATNTGYFDVTAGTPNGPLVVDGQPLVMSRQHEAVVGVVGDGRLAADDVWLGGEVRTPHHHYRIAAVNELWPPPGLSIYTSSWGHSPVPLHGAPSRAVSAAGRTTSVGRHDTVMRHGYLIVATDASARRALTHIRTADSVRVVTRVHSSGGDVFHQAYGVGSQLVRHPGHPVTFATCFSSNTRQPARTAIGLADGGRSLVVAMVTDHPFTSQHGLDNTQMAKLMSQLGVDRAFDLDGSGSTELLARLGGGSHLTRMTYPADGQERIMPLGLGVYDTATPAKN